MNEDAELLATMLEDGVFYVRPPSLSLTHSLTLCVVVWTYVARTRRPRCVDQVVRWTGKNRRGGSCLHRGAQGGGALRIGGLLDLFMVEIDALLAILRNAKSRNVLRSLLALLLHRRTRQLTSQEALTHQPRASGGRTKSGQHQKMAVSRRFRFPLVWNRLADHSRILRSPTSKRNSSSLRIRRPIQNPFRPSRQPSKRGSFATSPCRTRRIISAPIQERRSDSGRARRRICRLLISS